MSRLTSRTTVFSNSKSNLGGETAGFDAWLASDDSGLGNLPSSGIELDSSLDPQTVDFISDYFLEFTESLGLEAADGSGLENFAQPYVLSTPVPIPVPTPAPVAVPESTAVEGILVLAACFGISAVLKRWRFPSQSPCPGGDRVSKNYLGDDF